jgi:hypothetical protein
MSSRWRVDSPSSATRLEGKGVEREYPWECKTRGNKL